MLIIIHIFSIILIMQIVKRGLDGLLTGAEGREQATSAGHGGAADSRTRTRSVSEDRVRERTEAAAEDSLAEILARSRFGMAIAAMIKMIATTISNSINENPFCLRIFSTFSQSLLCIGLADLA